MQPLSVSSLNKCRERKKEERSKGMKYLYGKYKSGTLRAGAKKRFNGKEELYIRYLVRCEDSGTTPKKMTELSVNELLNILKFDRLTRQEYYKN